MITQDLTGIFEEFLQYMSAERNASISTLKSYETDFKIFNRFLQENGDKIYIDEIETRDCRRYIHYLKTEMNYATATIRRKIHSLSSFFKFALETDYINKNPMASIHAPKLEERLPIYLNEKDLCLLLSVPRLYSKNAKTKTRDRVLIALLVYTGERKSETLHLNWSDIDFDMNIIHIRQGKGKKDREIPLLKPLKKVILEYMDERKPLQSEPILISSKEVRMSTSNFQTIFKYYINACNLQGKSYTPHKCRHSYATLLYQNGVDIITIQQLLGHRDLNSTKIYTHMTTSFIQKELDKFPILTDA